MTTDMKPFVSLTPTVKLIGGTKVCDFLGEKQMSKNLKTSCIGIISLFQIAGKTISGIVEKKVYYFFQFS